MSVHEKRRRLNRRLQDAIVFLLNRPERWTEQRIGEAIGYEGGTAKSMVSQVLKGEKNFGAEAIRELSVLCSNLGYDELARYYCGDGKAPVNLSAGSLDERLDSEALDLMSGFGQALPLFDSRRAIEARPHLLKARAAVDTAIAECDALIARDSVEEWTVTVLASAPLPTFAGDGSPERA